MLLEVCVDSPTSAIAAEDGGADRVELCADLFSGGTTPSAGVISTTRECIEIPLHVMVRTQPGWLTSDLDFEVMKYDIVQAKNLGADGVVMGIVNLSRQIDTTRMAELIELAKPMSITFHRVFDLLADPLAGLEQLVGLGIDRVLTSGGLESSEKGIPRLTEVCRAANSRITILAGGGITLANAVPVVQATSVREVHVLSAVSVPSENSIEPYFPGHPVVDKEKVRRLKDLLSGLG